ncbi:MAG: PEP-CTERM sorting domain-containing protein [Chloroflexi bacterium]|nr:PEP-CTERM sorting domain-containing protein [Chloroflexota bacterium]
MSEPASILLFGILGSPRTDVYLAASTRRCSDRIAS